MSKNRVASAANIYSPPVLGPNILEDLSPTNLDSIYTGGTAARTRDEAFAAARRNKQRYFDWEGDQYHTMIEGETTPLSPDAYTMQARNAGGFEAMPPPAAMAQRPTQTAPSGILYDPRGDRRFARQERRQARQDRRQTRRDFRNYVDPYSPLNRGV